MSLYLRFPSPIYKWDFWDTCGRQLFAQVTETLWTFLPRHLLNPRAASLCFTLPLALRFWSEKTRFSCTAPQVPPEKSSSDATNHRGEHQTLPGATRLVVTWGLEGSKTRSDAQTAQALADLPLAYWSRAPLTWGEHFSDSTSSEIVIGTIFPGHLVTPAYPPAQ